jgi:hypothetical protein
MSIAYRGKSAFFAFFSIMAAKSMEKTWFWRDVGTFSRGERRLLGVARRGQL